MFLERGEGAPKEYDAFLTGNASGNIDLSSHSVNNRVTVPWFPSAPAWPIARPFKVGLERKLIRLV